MDTIDARQQRGMVIANEGKLVKKSHVYIVPSQSDAKQKYTVALGKEPFCSCPDHDNGFKCKHIWACEITLTRTTQEENVDGSVTTTTESITIKRKSYPQIWPAYDRAQATEKSRIQVLLHDLCRNLAEPDESKKRGPKSHLVKDSIFAMAFKVYCGFSGRRFSTDLDEAHAKGFITRSIPGNKVASFLENEAFTAILTELVAKSAAPLAAVESDFAVDSTGFTTTRFEKWFDEKHGKQKSLNVWVKTHVIVGVKTNVVTAVRILEKESGDYPQLKPLLAKTVETFKVNELSGDKAYLGQTNFEEVDKIGGTFLPMFKENSTGGIGGLFGKMYAYFCFQRDEYLGRYHKRSNVESTFSAVKRKFGDSVRSKTDVAMKNEVLCKLLCHNLCCLVQEQEELGIAPIFWKNELNSSVVSST